MVGCVFIGNLWLSTMGFITSGEICFPFSKEWMQKTYISIGEPVGKGMQSLLKLHGPIIIPPLHQYFDGDSLVPDSKRTLQVKIDGTVP